MLDVIGSTCIFLPLRKKLRYNTCFLKPTHISMVMNIKYTCCTASLVNATTQASFIQKDIKFIPKLLFNDITLFNGTQTINGSLGCNWLVLDFTVAEGDCGFNRHNINARVEKWNWFCLRIRLRAVSPGFEWLGSAPLITSGEEPSKMFI